MAKTKSGILRDFEVAVESTVQRQQYGIADDLFVTRDSNELQQLGEEIKLLKQKIGIAKEILSSHSDKAQNIEIELDEARDLLLSRSDRVFQERLQGKGKAQDEDAVVSEHSLKASNALLQHQANTISTLTGMCISDLQEGEKRLVRGTLNGHPFEFSVGIPNDKSVPNHTSIWIHGEEEKLKNLLGAVAPMKSPGLSFAILARYTALIDRRRKTFKRLKRDFGAAICLPRGASSSQILLFNPEKSFMHFRVVWKINVTNHTSDALLGVRGLITQKLDLYPIVAKSFLAADKAGIRKRIIKHFKDLVNVGGVWHALDTLFRLVIVP